MVVGIVTQIGWLRNRPNDDQMLAIALSGLERVAGVFFRGTRNGQGRRNSDA
jgi:hypothetical protein